MMELHTSFTEENYLKAIFKINERTNKAASTNAIAYQISTSAASVTDMLKRLSEKGLINYEKYKGVTLTPGGNRIATNLIRKHRLWEVFLVTKLNFSWEQVHEIAEELEHIKSDSLINRLDNFLGNPRFDPHGDPIPNAEGKFMIRNQTSMDQMLPGTSGVLVGVREHDVPFLEYLNDIKVNIGTEFTILDKIAFDESLKVVIDKEREMQLSREVSRNLLIKRIND